MFHIHCMHYNMRFLPSTGLLPQFPTLQTFFFLPSLCLSQSQLILGMVECCEPVNTGILSLALLLLGCVISSNLLHSFVPQFPHL